MTVEEHSCFKAEGFRHPEVAPDSKSPTEPDPPRLGRGARQKHPPGYFKALNNGKINRDLNTVAIYQDINKLIDPPIKLTLDLIQELVLTAPKTPPKSYREATKHSDYKTRYKPAMLKQLEAL